MGRDTPSASLAESRRDALRITSMTRMPDESQLGPYDILEDPFGDRVKREAQKAPVRTQPDMTLRDEANAITVYAFRNGFIEDLHAAGRVTQAEMKRLNIQISARLAHWLYVRDNCRSAVPKRYFEEVAEYRRYAREWDREALDAEVPASEYAPCAGCARPLPVHAWRFCPSCGAQISTP
jgi:hypothetical protein